MKFQCNVGQTSKNKIKVFGRDIKYLIEHGSIGEMICRAIQVDHTEQNIEMVEAIFVAFIDHGLDPPSTIAARMAANCKVNLPQSLSAGLACFGDTHCPIQQCMEMLYRYKRSSAEPDIPVYGLGHPIHDIDPRVQPLFDIAEHNLIAGIHVCNIKDFSKKYKQPINYAGAASAILCDMRANELNAGILPIISRLLGLSIHYKEQLQDKKFRTWQP